MEFKTTSQPASATPYPPEGDGWTLAGCANRVAGVMSEPVVYMYWQRKSQPTLRVCGNCRSVAFRPDGRCVGCSVLYSEG